MPVNETLMSPAYRRYVYQRYDVLGHIEFKSFDHDWVYFENWLRSFYRASFEVNQRIVIEHMDTDFYRSDVAYGLNISNLFRAWRTVDIPFFVMLLYTNHFGIEREIYELAPDEHDRPTLISTFVNNRHVAASYQDLDLAPDHIQKPALCMMAGTGRVHRHATYRCFEQSDLLDYIAVTVSSDQ